MKHVFISYAHIDHDFAEIVKLKLSSAEIATWLDEERLKAGEDWRSAIDAAIQASFSMIVVVSPAAIESKYVTYEWAYALGIGIKLIPVLYKQGEPHPRLDSLQHLDFTNPLNRPWERLIERLKEVLESDLVQMGDSTEAKAHLRDALKALGSWKPKEREEAAKVLGSLGDISASDALVHSLHDSTMEVRRAAAEALGNLAHRSTSQGSTSQELRTALHDQSHAVRFAAAIALGKLGDSSSASEILQMYIGLEDDEWSEDEISREQLGDTLRNVVDNSSVPTLITWLNGDDIEARDMAIELLGQIKDESAIPFLLMVSHEGFENTREAVFDSLAQFENLPDLRRLFKRLSNSKIEIRQKAIDNIEASTGIPGLLAALASNESKGYWEVSKKLTETVKVSDKPLLLQVLEHGSTRARGLIAEILGQHPELESCETLISLSKDHFPFVRGLAIRALGRLNCHLAARNIEARLKDKGVVYSNSVVQVRDYASIALGKLGEYSATSGLIRILATKNEELVEEAIDILVQLSDPSIVDELLKLLKKPDPWIQSRVVDLIGDVGNGSAISSLIPFLDSNDGDVRSITQNAIFRLTDDISSSSLQDLVKRVRNSRIETRIHVIDLICDIVDYSPEAVANALKDLLDSSLTNVVSELIHGDDIYARIQAIRLLGWLGDGEVLPTLQKLVADHDTECDIRCAAAKSLGELGRPVVVRTLIDQIDDDCDSPWFGKLSGIIASSLEAIGTKEALEAVSGWRETTRTNDEVIQDTQNE